MKGVLYSVAPKGGLTGGALCALDHAAFLKDRFEGGACLVVIEDTPLEARAGALGIPVLKLPFVNAGLRQAGGWKKLRALPEVVGSRLAFSRVLARKLRGTGGVLHVQSLAQHTVYALRAGRKARVPVALTIHEPPQDLGARDRRSDLFFVRRWKPHVVTLTEFTRSAVAPLLGACPVRIIPNAAVLPPAAEMVQAIAARQRHRPPTVLLVGALCERKGTDVFVRACGILKGKGIAFRAEIVGGALDAAYGDSIRALVASEGVAETVVLAGERREGMDGIYRKGDVLAVPSRRENYPRVIMEAMGWGMPVVASAVDGIPSMVTDGGTGLLVPPDNPEALAAALERLLLAPQLRSDLGEAGRKRAETLFSLEKYADAMMELYRDAGVP